MSKIVLILTSKDDVHADAVEKILRGNLDVTVVRLNSNRTNSRREFFLSFNKSSKSRFEIRIDDQSIDLREIISIWWRKPDFWMEDNSSLKLMEGLSITYKRDELYSLYWNFSLYLERLGKFIVSRVEKISEASQKLNQLDVAQKIGFEIPDTVVTSNIARITEFYNSHRQNCIIKPLYRGVVEYGNKIVMIPTQKFNQSEFIKYFKKSSLNYPTLLQENIEKKFELRINIMGKFLHCCAIDSQSKKESSLDWREVDPDSIKHSNYNLPKSIAEKCFALCRYYNLEYSAIDMAVSLEGKYVFFELNPNGQYLWIERLTKAKLSQAMANLLSDPEKYRLCNTA